MRLLPAALILLALPACTQAPEGEPPVERGDAMLHEDVAQLLDELVTAVRKDPLAAAPRGELGLAYDANGLREEAVLSYGQATAIDPQDARWWYHASIALVELGDYPRATVHLKQAIEHDPDYAPAYWRFGQLLFAQGELDGAEAAFREAARRRPQHPAGAIGVARVQLQRGEAAAAADLLEETLRTLSRAQFLPYVHYLLGTAYRQLGRMDEARRELGQGRRGRPLWKDNRRREIDQYRVSLNGRLRATTPLLETGQSEKAIAILEGLREEAPTDEGVLAKLASAYMNVGRVEDAKTTLEALVAVHPDDDRAYYNLSRVDLALGSTNDALRFAAHCVELNPHVAAWHVNHGEILEYVGRREEALEAYRAALGCDPSDEAALMRAGSVAAALGFQGQARRHFERVLKDDPAHEEALRGLERLRETR
jgi:tetratricopeptide (TPR) repeat protein